MFSPFVAKIMDFFEEGIVITDSEGIILFCNARYFQISGLDASDLLGNSVELLVKKGVFNTVLNPEIVQTRQPVTRIQCLANGRKLILDGHPVLEDSGERVVYVATFIRDVTVLMNLQEQLTRQRELLDAFTLVRKNTEPCPLIPLATFKSTCMQRLNSTIDSLAAADVTVLLLGETGVGKDVLARRLHSMGTRKDQPFIKVDCGSIPESLIESELFGYMPGTFSGASKQGKVGLFEAANGGTVFLDEIGELPLAMQSRLLRVIQDREVQRVGSVKAVGIDVRVLAATNINIAEAVQQGLFRSDLYYRLKVAVVDIPPLRERMEDIPLLAHNFLEYYCQRYKRTLHLPLKLQKSLEKYHWPGNVRELENFIHALVVQNVHSMPEQLDLDMTSDRGQRGTERKTVPVHGQSVDAQMPQQAYKKSLELFEFQLFSDVLAQCKTLGAAAKHLHMDRSTLFRKIQALHDAGYILPCRKIKRKGKTPHGQSSA